VCDERLSKQLDECLSCQARLQSFISLARLVPRAIAKSTGQAFDEWPNELPVSSFLGVCMCLAHPSLSPIKHRCDKRQQNYNKR